MIIIDDFLCDDYLNQIQGVIPTLGYNPHGSYANVFNFFNSIGHPWPNTDTFNYMAKKIQNLTYMKESSIIRVYVNLHTTGKNHCGDFHEDDGQITALYYPMTWDKKYGGGTEFEDGTVVDYVTNRLVLFDANKKHRGMEHTNENLFRYTVAFKMNAGWK